MTSDATDLQQPAELLTGCVCGGGGREGLQEVNSRGHRVGFPWGTALHQAERLPNEMAPVSPLDQVALLRLNTPPLM